ncbi:MAG: HAMP domain-containing histidine kinase [Lachnospiraceae bacterium]|nr:HAMP domain-containing histidine kinase [Lachnospiraceae bacterium]
MKLRTRIIAISCIMLLTASMAVNIVTLTLMWKSIKNEAFIKAYQNTYMKMQEVKQRLIQVGELVDREFLEYYFKSYNDEYFICMYIMNENSDDGNEEIYEIYNHTIFGNDYLENLKYTRYEEMEYTYVQYEGRNYIVFAKGIEGFSGLTLYRFEDITYAKNNVEKFAFSSVLITLLVVAVTIFVLFCILKHEFEPLQELNSVTKSITDNMYDRRVVIRKKDEIGQIGENFNKMAEAVEARTKRLEESERRKTLFMGNLTHELKTPMTAISGYAQTLLSVKLDEEDKEDALEYIYKECTRLERLSQKMMKLLLLEQDGDLEFKEVSAKTLFEAAAKSCSTILKEKDINLEYEENGEIFLMDIDLMTDVIINFIDNGVKASNKGGRIILRSYGNCIEVQDFGRGIPKEEQEKIMEPFYMVDKSRSRKSGGAGLGLALAALIAKRHNILLKIDSEPGQGTRMILQFV